MLLTLLLASSLICSAAEIHDAIRSGEADQVRSLLKKDPDLVSAPDEHGVFPLHYAAMTGDAEIVKLLISSGAKVNKKIKNGGLTPLHVAVEMGHIETVRVLLENGAEVNEKTEKSLAPPGEGNRSHSGETPLHIAVRTGNLEMVDLLLDKGADPGIKNDKGQTPLFYAISANLTDIEKVLKKHGSGETSPKAEKLRHIAQLAKCKANLRRIAVALEMYADRYGKYPDSLKDLIPEFMDKLPECPAAGKETYSKSYSTGPNNVTYRMYCIGHHHKEAGLERDFPLYTSKGGLREKPLGVDNDGM